MINIKEKKNCSGCHACANVCPKKAITMKEDKKGFKYPIIDYDKCTECNFCKKVCPILNNKKENPKEVLAYACQNKDDEARLNSSSGGVFILLAKEIIKKGGVVFGAYLDESFNVIHGYAETEEELKKFMGSKYVQSIIGDQYIKVKEILQKDKYVLFTGTPCQIEGLKSYLGKEYNKLYTQDIICHGVPSPLVWDKYKKYRKENDDKDPIKISFRCKEKGWMDYSILFKYDKDKYQTSHKNDLYMRAFLRNTILRESCYDCSFKKKYRESDITLGDYWGIKNVHPDMDDDKGTSLVLVNSNKGKELLGLIKDEIKYIETNLELAINYNPSMIKSAKKDKYDKDFFENLQNMSFDKLVKMYTQRVPFIKRVEVGIKRTIKRLLRMK